jgi:hypothetical protein
VLGDPLVKRVPRREAELRLELADDPEREEEEAGDERDDPRGEPAADARRRVHPLTLVEGS